MILNKTGTPVVLGVTLNLDRCPHCSISNPHLRRLAGQNTSNDRGANTRNWGWYACETCGGCVIAVCPVNTANISDYYPKNETVSSFIPERAASYLTQAIASLHSPSGCIMLCASSTDAMLKAKGYKAGKLYTRIKEAETSHLITKAMAEWFHHVRLQANEERHDDEETSMPTEVEAQKCIDFVKALGEFLFVLPARIAEGIKEPVAQSTPNDGQRVTTG